ncbi:hypothetical protein ABE10_02180, partial [Bacillus toyonensis]|nr:hypothetical protein [Bacillus toyonensis]
PANAESGQPGLLTQRESHDGRAVGLLQRAPQENVGLGGRRVRLQVVRLVQGEQVDLIRGDEFDHVDLSAALSGE